MDGNGLSPDQLVVTIAAHQHGVFSCAQALEAGLTPTRIRHRVDSGRWRRIARSTFALPGAPETWQQSLLVACLARPNGTVASHLSAAALYNLWTPPPLPQVTVPEGASARLPGAVVRRSALGAADTDRVGGIPVTRPARTLVDCAAVLEPADLCELLDDVLCRRMCRAGNVHAAMERAGRSGRPGVAALDRALDVWAGDGEPGSVAEMRLVRRLVAWGFPAPERQVKIFDEHGRFVARIDLGWADRRVGLEYYGKRHHGPRQEEHDSLRLARVERQAWEIRVVRDADVARPAALRAWLAPRLGLRIAV